MDSCFDLYTKLKNDSQNTQTDPQNVDNYMTADNSSSTGLSDSDSDPESLQTDQLQPESALQQTAETGTTRGSLPQGPVWLNE